MRRFAGVKTPRLPRNVRISGPDTETLGEKVAVRRVGEKTKFTPTQDRHDSYDKKPETDYAR
jgi:hypothetical protein